MFEPGDIVECVDARNSAALVRGAVYTVTNVLPGGRHRHDTMELTAFGILLQEVAPNPGHTAFADNRFRLLKRRDPDLMRKLLTEPAPDVMEAA